jgi:hypothetical protein
MTHALILNIALGAAAFVTVVGFIAWSIVTQANRRRARRRRTHRVRAELPSATVTLGHEAASE